MKALEQGDPRGDERHWQMTGWCTTNLGGSLGVRSEVVRMRSVARLVISWLGR